MCGRYTLHTEKEALAERFDFDPADAAALAPHWNIAPTQSVWVVRVLEGRRRAAAMRWGLVPSWAKDPKALPQMINARAETVASKPSYRTALSRRRCLIPADGFYEWQAPVPPAKRKVPHWIGLASGEPFAFAGLWESWAPPGELTAERLLSCTILTTSANAALAPIHERMPVILPREREAAWLDPALDGKVEALLELLQPVDAELLAARPISTRVNSVRHDDPSVLEAADPPELGF